MCFWTQTEKIWVDKGRGFYKNSLKSWLQNNNAETYWTHNEWKSFAAARFIGTFMNKIYKYMTSISKNVFIKILCDILKKYKNAYNRTIKMKPVNVKSITYINFDKENDYKDPKFKVGDCVKISEYKKYFCKRLNSKVVPRSFCY